MELYSAGDGNVNDYFMNNDKVIITDVDTRAQILKPFQQHLSFYIYQYNFH